MFGLRPEDYAREHGRRFGDKRRKNQTVYQTKVRLPTQHRTKKKKKCSLCSEESVQRIQISETEFRELCQKHFSDWRRKDFKYSVKFERAND